MKLHFSPSRQVVDNWIMDRIGLLMSLYPPSPQQQPPYDLFTAKFPLKNKQTNKKIGE